jgi:hypothetical protein
MSKFQFRSNARLLILGFSSSAKLQNFTEKCKKKQDKNVKKNE